MARGTPLSDVEALGIMAAIGVVAYIAYKIYSSGGLTQLPANVVTGAGNAVGSTMDAIGEQVIPGYDSIPSTWSGVGTAIENLF